MRAQQPDWERVKTDIDRLLAEREVQGPIKHRGEARAGSDLWDLSWQQELTIRGDARDKAAARAYVHTLADQMLQLQLPQCSAWRKLKKTPCREEK